MKANKWHSYRRQMLDTLQEKYKHLYQGVVLDIGGRERGSFKKPKNEVKKWIFADINEVHNPDIILDISNMDAIQSNSIDVVNAIELFEHVKEIELGLKECYRVLKENGLLIISAPFLSPIHADPYDYQRWTYSKWIYELKRSHFKIEKFINMGKFYTFLAELLKTRIKRLGRKKRYYCFCLPFLDFIIKKDNKPSIKNDYILNNYHNGYFIIARK